MLIYQIKSLINSKIYVGQTTTSLEKRILSYKGDVSAYLRGKYKARSKIIPAIAKYGISNFVFSVIDTASSQDELDQKEVFWIAKLQTTTDDIGFNIQNGGFGVGKHSEETKKIMSDKKKGKPAHNKGKPGLSGENVGNASLTQEQANQIRKDYLIIKSASKLAKIYKVSKPTILSIINNERYKTDAGPVILPPPFWFVYVIQSQKDDTLYTGITLDVEARLKTHNEERGARYTKGRTPFVLIASFKVLNKGDALRAEYRIKQLSKSDKLLVKGFDSETRKLIF
jgi:putative endonuclease